MGFDQEGGILFQMVVVFFWPPRPSKVAWLQLAWEPSHHILARMGSQSTSSCKTILHGKLLLLHAVILWVGGCVCLFLLAGDKQLWVCPYCAFALALEANPRHNRPVATIGVEVPSKLGRARLRSPQAFMPEVFIPCIVAFVAFVAALSVARPRLVS